MTGGLFMLACGAVLLLSVPFAAALGDGLIGLARIIQNWRARL
jgi:hypothetical protein